MGGGAIKSYSRFGLVSRKCPDEVSAPAVRLAKLVVIVIVVIVFAVRITVSFVMLRSLANLLDLDLRHALLARIPDHFFAQEKRKCR